ncbi:hypothetical protein VTL71DRAFT_3413 [Oculimacula yallundae]|uniref:Uncharacterized protein n=1 Tax=Oculimacula yallundae TaxID=86028 RepID=A0ABR4C743_9HELO
MGFTLRPQHRNGLMRWDVNALILHFFWGWQFILACAMELFFTMCVITLGDNHLTHDNIEIISAYTFFTLTLTLVIVLLTEICFFANSHLEVNKWLILQIVKFVYAATVFGFYAYMFAGCKDYIENCTSMFVWRGNWVDVRRTWIVLGGFCRPPWITGLVLGSIMKLQDRKMSTKDFVVEEEVRRPLLPRAISSAERRAVYR